MAIGTSPSQGYSELLPLLSYLRLQSSTLPTAAGAATKAQWMLMSSPEKVSGLYGAMKISSTACSIMGPTPTAEGYALYKVRYRNKVQLGSSDSAMA